MWARGYTHVMTVLIGPALVLRRHRFSESSLVLHLFAREWGRIEGLAKGCRREKSPLRGHFDLFAVEEIVAYERPKGALDLVTDSHIAREWQVLRTDPRASAVASVAAEMLLRGCMVRDPHPRAFDAICAEMERLQSGARPGSVAVVLYWKLLSELGFRPKIDACCQCGAEGTPGAGVALSGTRGGLVCSKCEPDRRAQRLGNAAAAALNAIGNMNFDNGLNLSLLPAAELDLLSALLAFAEDSFGFGLKSGPILLQLLGQTMRDGRRRKAS